MIIIQTINDLFINFPNFFSKTNIKLDKNHIITEYDIENEKIFKKYKNSSYNVLTRNGLSYENNTIYFYFTKLRSIKIYSSKEIVEPLNETVTFYCVGIVEIYRNNELFKVIEQKIHPIYSFNGNNFFQKKNTINFNDNKSYYENKCIINAIFGYNKEIFQDSLIVTQKSNYLSDWIFINEDVNSLDIIPDTNFISKNGGVINISVYKNYIMNYVKKDVFGEIIMQKKSDLITENITNNCKITVNLPHTNTENTIYVLPQEINAESRYIHIHVSYLKYEKYINIIQENGDKYNFQEILSFIDGTKNFNIILQDNTNKTEIVKLKNVIQKTLNGEIIDESINDSTIAIKINNDNWIKCELLNKTLLSISIDKNNNEDYRYNQIILQCHENKLCINITQPPRVLINTMYDIKFSYNKNIAINEKLCQLKFKIIRINVYNDGSIVECNTLQNNHILKVICNDSELNTLYEKENEEYITYFLFDNIDTQYANLQYYIITNNKEIISKQYHDSIKIDYEKIEQEIELTVKVKNNTQYDIISFNRPNIYIINEDNRVIFEDKLSYCWINSKIETDDVYYYKIKLTQNKIYKFIIEPYIFDNITSEQIQEEYKIESDDEGIDFIIDIKK